MSGAAIRVVLVDDHPLVQEGIRQALSGPGFDVVGEAGDGPTALGLTGAIPDVVILDINLPGGNGIDLIGPCKTKWPGAKVLMLSVHDHAEYVLESVKAGAHGYLRKDSRPSELRDAVRAVFGGETRYAVVAGVKREDASPILAQAAASRLALLTRREREVLIGVASGKTNKELAAELGLRVRTVESYRESMIRKVGVPSTAGLTRLAIEARLIP